MTSHILQPLSPPLEIVLVAPQIPPNTGNVARLCAVTGCRLHLVEPLGFSIADRELKRAGLDYWDKVFVKLHASVEAYLADFPSARRVLFSARASQSLYEVRFAPGDHLVFGSETEGLPKEFLARERQVATIPMLAQRRSLNLSTAVGIGTYEAIRQLSAPGAAGRARSLESA